MKFQIGQEVMIISGARYGKVGKVTDFESGFYNWYQVMVDGCKYNIGYAECELEPV